MENGYKSEWGDLLETEEIEGDEEIEEEAEEEISTDEDANEIMIQAFNKLYDKSLKEDELKKIIETALTIKIDFQKCEILINVAEHPQASTELIQEIKEHISNEMNDSGKRNTYLDQIDKILTIQSLEKLKDVNLKEEELEEILEIASNIKTNSEKCEILVNIAEHPQASIELMQEIRQQIFEIDDENIKTKYLNRIDNFYANKIMELSFDKLNNAMNSRIKRKGLKKIIEIALTIKTDYEKSEILAKAAEHPRASIKLIEEIMWYYYSGEIKDYGIIENNLNRIHKALDEKENRTKTKQLKQYKEASEEFSTGPLFALLD